MDIQSQVEYNEMIINEREENINKISNDILMINEIMKDLNKIVCIQSEPINQIEEQINNTLTKTNNSVKLLEQANSYHEKSSYRKLKLLGLGLVGIAINTPVTIIFGLKVGLISSLSTIGISSIATLF